MRLKIIIAAGSLNNLCTDAAPSARASKGEIMVPRLKLKVKNKLSNKLRLIMPIVVKIPMSGAHGRNPTVSPKRKTDLASLLRKCSLKIEHIFKSGSLPKNITAPMIIIKIPPDKEIYLALLVK